MMSCLIKNIEILLGKKYEKHNKYSKRDYVEVDGFGGVHEIKISKDFVYFKDRGFSLVFSWRFKVEDNKNNLREIIETLKKKS